VYKTAYSPSLRCPIQDRKQTAAQDSKALAPDSFTPSSSETSLVSSTVNDGPRHSEAASRLVSGRVHRIVLDVEHGSPEEVRQNCAVHCRGCGPWRMALHWRFSRQCKAVVGGGREDRSDCVGKAWLIYNNSIQRHRTLTKPAPSRGPEEAPSPPISTLQ
jgi:hypothetical protein